VLAFATMTTYVGAGFGACIPPAQIPGLHFSVS